MSESVIKQLIEITGLDRQNATTILKINNNNLEEAINYHLESGGDGIGGGDDGGGGGGGGDSSVSENASLPDYLPIENDRPKLKSNYMNNNDNNNINNNNDEDEIRAPIPPIREQLIQPEYDQFSYQYNNLNTRKRRLTPATFSVCPFRNFAREAEQLEEEFNNGSSSSSTSCSNNNQQHNNNIDNNTNKSLQLNNQQQQYSNNLLTTTVKRKRLEDLFRPPSDILFLGTFQSARDHSTNLNRWLIVNLQDHHEFQSQILNRDIWSDKHIREIILSHFILCQISLDNPEGIRFKTFYRVMNLPYVCILDPRTGEDKLTCDTTTPSILYDQLRQFMDDNSYGLDPNNPPFNNLQNQQSQLNNSSLSICNGPSTSVKDPININRTTNNYKNDLANNINGNHELINCGKNNNLNHNNKLINNKKQLLELSEQDQLNLAIQNSLKEKRCTITTNQSYSDEDDDDDDDDCVDDDDDDDDNKDINSDINNSNSITVNHQNNINKLNNNNNEKQHKKCQKSYNKNDIESYVNYMGNITDQLTKIQIRLPFGDRECLEWPSSTLLRAIVLYVHEKYPTITKNTYKLISPYPKQNILELDYELTLLDAKLHPSAVLYLHPDD